MESLREPIGRRQFLQYLGVAVTAVGLGSGLAACGDGESGGAGADTITYAQGADPRSLDPAFFDDGESAKVACNIYEGLYQYGEKDTVVYPALAVELPDISPDGKTYNIKLREGVKFHDGTTFTAADVVKSWERQLEPNLTPDMPYATFVFGESAIASGLSKIEVVDDYNITLTMRAPSTAFLKNMAMTLAAPIVSGSALDANNGNIGEQPCGTGPYKFESWTKADNVKLVAFDDYWDKATAPKTKNVVFKVIPENATRVTALINGEADIIDGIDVSAADQILSNGFTLFNEDGMTINYMAFCTDSEICKDQDVRIALAQAINVPELVTALYGEYASVANSVMPEFMAPFAKNVKQPAYDEAAARTALAAKGITKLTCITYTNPRPYNPRTGLTLAETIAGYFAKVGVTMEIIPYDWTTYKTKVQTDPYDICFYGWTGDNGDPDNFMNLLADSNWSMNVAHWSDNDYKKLIKDGLETPEGPDRDAIYLKCEEMVAEKVPWLVLSHSKNLCGLDPKINGYYYHPTGSVFLKGTTKSL
ncbi:MAG: ABC transporter substrate-binding protein [Coriobacteriia bacterium]|nr:ABC transporter substrate-binding protein [Coriobacteriia bacterium]